jgi:hypothetical protein
MRTTCMTTVLGIVFTAAGAAHGDGPAAHWEFRETAGEVAHDRTGGGHDGRVHGTRWDTAAGSGIRFAGSQSFVAAPRKTLFDAAGEATLVAWVKPLASPWKNTRTNYVIFATSDYGTSGFVIRVDGESSHLCYVGFLDGGVSSSISQTPLVPGKFHQVTLVKRRDQIAWYLDGRPDGSAAMPRTGPLSDTLWISEPSQSFDGLIADMKIYGRAVSGDEVLRNYRQSAGKYGLDTSQFGKIGLTPFLYLTQKRAVAEVDFSGVLPLGEGERLEVELTKEGKRVESRAVSASTDKSVETYVFDLSRVSAGRYELCARLVRGYRPATQAVTAFTYPSPPLRVPSPRERITAALPAAPPSPPITVTPAAAGGFTLCLGEKSVPIESRFTYPRGGENAFCPSEKIEGAPQWKPNWEKGEGGRLRVVGQCPHYRIQREIRVEPHRVVVRDTIGNLTSEALGIIVRNQAVSDGLSVSALLGGEPGRGMRDIKINPTVFVASRGLGLGLVALDDVYVVQARGFFENGRAGILTNEFALDANAQYTMEWAIYPNTTGDYYDFINLARHDEGRGGVTVEGGFAFYPTGAVPSREYLEIRGTKYFSAPCLSHVIDEPSISLEGIEFIKYPKVRRQLREQFAAVTRIDPSIRCMFHIAHALYATNKPELFADARVVDAKGRQQTYGNSEAYYYGGGYFSKERLDQGWRWWIYCPTRENSFGQAMLRSVDMMVDEIGCRGAFMDGFMWIYGSDYTYNRWDRHSADIDPLTKTITRKKGSVLLLSQELLAEYVRKFNQRGGTVIANYPVFTRTIAREKMICDQECRVGPDIHFTHTPITLGRSGTLHTEQHVYRDVREALANGNLYFYYGEGDLTTKSVPAYMYPITIEEIRGGCVRGRERIVTMNAGVYGWSSEADMHQIWLFDRRGALADHELFSTTDREGVRTELPLQEGQTAVIRRIPIRVASAAPVNVYCAGYGPELVRLVVHGHGDAKLVLRTGEFAVKPGTGYRVQGSGPKRLIADAASTLTVPVVLDGQKEIVVQKAP